MVTIYDIAKACNCSSATVSKVFNNVGNISEGKRKEILSAAEKMGYVPNVTARNLVKRRSNMVGVLLFIDESLGLRNELFAEILNRFRTEMERNGYEIVLISEKGTQWSGKFLDHCRSLRLDGIFCLCCNYQTDSVRELIESSVPVVGFESPYPGKPSVESKNFEASKMLTEYLISHGHREIVFVSGTDNYITRERIRGYKAALEEHGIPFEQERLRYAGYFSSDGGTVSVKQMLSCSLPYTAAMLPDDFTAISAYRLLSEKGLYVGKNFSVTGFDGISIGNMISPCLTTIRQDTYRIGKCASELLLNLMDGKPIEEPHVRLDASLICGESVCKIG